MGTPIGLRNLYSTAPADAPWTALDEVRYEPKKSFTFGCQGEGTTSLQGGLLINSKG